ncbi:MAG: sensor histidine kinase [Spirochaetaceae bacterium]|nr:MAG: sensor histidine kinase [Spirochaetaceae bacterium]
MKTLFSRTFLSFLATLAVVVIVLGAMFLFAVQRSIDDWNTYRGFRLQSLILPIITRVYRQEGELSEPAIAEALSQFLTANQFVYIFDVERRPVFLYSRGERITPAEGEPWDPTQLGAGYGPAAAVFEGDEVIAYLSADTLGFTSDLANRRFLATLIVAVFVGILVSLGAALGFAFVFSKKLAAQARVLADGLHLITSGRRNVTFPASPAAELAGIADSAKVLQNQLRTEEGLRRQWAEDIAHDLRTPVTALKTQFEAMMEGYLSVSRERIATLFDEVARIERLVNDLRELSRIESPEMKTEIECLATDDVINQVNQVFLMRAEESGVPLVTETDATAIYADRHLLLRAITNVVENAFQHVAPHGRVHIRIHRIGENVAVDVLNTGYIDPETCERVFDRMYRGESSRGTPGSGLGLTITKAIIDLHGGRIGIFQDSEMTRVRITFPHHDRATT